MAYVNILPLFSTPLKSIISIHKHGKFTYDFPYDLIAVVTIHDVVQVIVVDKINFNVKTRFTVHFYSRSLELIKQVDPTVSSIVLNNIHGFWHLMNNRVSLTLFLEVKDPSDRTWILTWTAYDILSDNPTQRTYLRLSSKFSGFYKLIVGVMIKANYVYSDTKSIDSDDTYIVYIDMEDGTSSIAGKIVYGTRVLVTTEEKLEFQRKNNVEVPLSIGPIVDDWTERDEVLYKLPDDAEQVKFDFSNGLAYVRFSSDNEQEYENFHI